jgi:hypothetical protein
MPLLDKAWQDFLYKEKAGQDFEIIKLFEYEIDDDRKASGRRKIKTGVLAKRKMKNQLLSVEDVYYYIVAKKYPSRKWADEDHADIRKYVNQLGVPVDTAITNHLMDMGIVNAAVLVVALTDRMYIHDDVVNMKFGFNYLSYEGLKDYKKQYGKKATSWIPVEGIKVEKLAIPLSIMSPKDPMESIMVSV